VLNGFKPFRKDIIELKNQTILNENQIKNWFNDLKKKIKRVN